MRSVSQSYRIRTQSCSPTAMHAWRPRPLALDVSVRLGHPSMTGSAEMSFGGRGSLARERLGLGGGGSGNGGIGFLYARRSALLIPIPWCGWAARQLLRSTPEARGFLSPPEFNHRVRRPRSWLSRFGGFPYPGPIRPSPGTLEWRTTLRRDTHCRAVLDQGYAVFSVASPLRPLAGRAPPDTAYRRTRETTHRVRSGFVCDPGERTRSIPQSPCR
jgi:hypothetical protein